MASEGGAPPQPKAILRGHKAQVHAACFIRENARLVTGDAEGFVVVWDLTIMRPRAVWQAHANAILGISGWQDDKIITHGRDNKLIVWKLAAEDEAAMSTSLPLTPVPETRPQPWLLHLLEVNTMNFCAFAACEAAPPVVDATGVLGPDPELSVAVPNTLASEAVDIFHLPSQRRTHTIKLAGDKNGMVMALSIFQRQARLLVVAGYENGLAIVASLDGNGNVTTLYQAKPHSQPILSLDVSPDKSYFITSSADALLVKHPIPPPQTAEADPSTQPTPQTTRNDKDDIGPGNQKGKPVSLLSAALSRAPEVGRRPAAQSAQSAPVILQTEPLKVVNTKHAGQQSLRIRSDGKVFATAGWDSRVRVYSAKTMKEVAVLKWHQVGCYAAAFSPIRDQDDEMRLNSTSETGLESSQREVVPRLVDVTVKERRVKNAESAHWLAAGSKDGKVSLWDVF